MESFRNIRGYSISFQTFFCTGIQNYHRLFKIQYIISMHLLRWLANFYDFWLKWTPTAGIGIHPSDCRRWWISKIQSGRQDTSEERYAIKFCFKLGKMPWDESWIYCYEAETKRQNSHAGSPRPKKARQSKSTHKLLMIPFLTALTWSTCTRFPLDRQSKRNTMLRF